ncbi:MAG: glycosyltransferase family 2 protein, partial [Phormidesmis sp.]
MSQPVITPLLTIIIPTYSRPHLLGQAVQSALGQKLEGEPEESIEVIVVDDASPQPVDILKNARLKVVRLSQNQGIAAARNVGLKAAKGRYVTYLDDDDQLLPNMANLTLTA